MLKVESLEDPGTHVQQLLAWLQANTDNNPNYTEDPTFQQLFQAASAENLTQTLQVMATVPGAKAKVSKRRLSTSGRAVPGTPNGEAAQGNGEAPREEEWQKQAATDIGS